MKALLPSQQQRSSVDDDIDYHKHSRLNNQYQPINNGQGIDDKAIVAPPNHSHQQPNYKQGSSNNNNHKTNNNNPLVQKFLNLQQTFLQITLPLLQLALSSSNPKELKMNNFDVYNELHKAFHYAVHDEISGYYQLHVITNSGFTLSTMIHSKYPLCIMLLILVLIDHNRSANSKAFHSDVTEVFTEFLLPVAKAIPSLKSLIILTIVLILKYHRYVIEECQYRLCSWVCSQCYLGIPFSLILPPDRAPDDQGELSSRYHPTQPPFVTRSTELRELFDRVQYALIEEFGESVGKLKVYGSSVNGFGLTSSDIDTMLDVSEIERVTGRSDMSRFLQRVSSAIRMYIPPPSHQINKTGMLTVACDCQLNVVSQARIPILRITQDIMKQPSNDSNIVTNQIEISISINHYFPIMNSKLLYCYSKLLDPYDEESSESAVSECGSTALNGDLNVNNVSARKNGTSVNPLVLFITTVKQWAKCRRGLADSTNGGLSSYSWTIMAIAYLIETRWLPCLGGSWQQESTVKRACLANDRKVRDPPQQLFYDWISQGKTAEDVMGAIRLQAWRKLYASATEDSHCEDGLRQMLTGFFEYYGYTFDFYGDAVDIRDKKGRIAKSEIPFNLSMTSTPGLKNSDRHKKMDWLWIVDPFELNRVIVPNEDKMEEIIEEFRRGYAICSTGESNRDWKGKLLDRVESIEDEVYIDVDKICKESQSMETLKQQLFRSMQ